MEDEAGMDAKLLAIPVAKIAPAYKRISEVEDMSRGLIEQIEHFFEHYKDLEKDKWVKVIGWGDSNEAKQEIEKSIAALKN